MSERCDTLAEAPGMPERGYSQLAVLLSLLGVVLISMGISTFIAGVSFRRSTNEHIPVLDAGPPAPVHTCNGQETGTLQSGAATVLSMLTTREWLFADRALQAEGFRLTFSRDGSFTRKVVSDYRETTSGVWAYKEIGPGVGLLFMRTTANSSAEPNSQGSEEVFRLRLTNNSLLLGRYSSRPDAGPPGRADQAKDLSIKDVINKKNFPTYFRLIGQPWIRLETKDSAFMPESLTLLGDGTVRASYRKEECRHDGYWSLERGQIFLRITWSALRHTRLSRSRRSRALLQLRRQLSNTRPCLSIFCF